MPARLGRYAVRRRIGAGGFATVWLAYDEQLDSPVAIKVLADNWTGDHHVRQRFLEEGRYLRKVESPHVVTVYDAGMLDDDRPYLVMSYADQGTLADRLEVDGLTVGQAVEVVRQIGEGLHALHQRGILHRDVKPANVLFRTVDPEHDGAVVRAMVGDLGLGKALDVSSRLTMIAGTPSFVAPEQAQGEHLDARADQFSLAALTYLMLTGRAPYAHVSLSAAAAPAPPPPLSTTDRPFPEAVEDVVRRGLARDRADRWPDVPAYLAALSGAFGDEGVDTRLPDQWMPIDPQLTQPGNKPSLLATRDPLPTTVSPRRSRWWPAAALALVLLVAGSIGGFTWWRNGHADLTVTDAQGVLSVTVPRTWDKEARLDGWVPPNTTSNEPALSIGDRADWTTRGQGVFAAVLPQGKMPNRLPGHKACGKAQAPDRSPVDHDAALTTTYTGCPGVVVERVVQFSTEKLLWIEVRSSDLATAHRVLDSVSAHGFF